MIAPSDRRNVAYLLAALAEHFEWSGQDRAAAKANARRFLRAFAGCTLIFPTTAELKAIDDERRIAEALDRDPSPGVVRRLSEVLGIDVHAVTKTYLRATGVGLTARRREIARVST